MAQKLRGVGGVLGGLISSAPEPSPEEQPAPPAVAEAIAQPAEAPAPAEIIEPTPEPAPPEPAPMPQADPAPRAKASPRVAARRGRPPGKKAGEGAAKEKVTLRLDKELMDDYRDWSWEERCQVGELVERALLQFRKSRRPKGQ